MTNHTKSIMKHNNCVSIYRITYLPNETRRYSIYDVNRKTWISHNAFETFTHHSYIRFNKYLSMETRLIPYDKIWKWSNERYLRRMFPVFTQAFIQILFKQLIMITNQKNKQISLILWDSSRYFHFPDPKYDYIHTNDHNHSYERKCKDLTFILSFCNNLHYPTNHIFQHNEEIWNRSKWMELKNHMRIIGFYYQ